MEEWCSAADDGAEEIPPTEKAETALDAAVGIQLDQVFTLGSRELKRQALPVGASQPRPFETLPSHQPCPNLSADRVQALVAITVGDHHDFRIWIEPAKILQAAL